MLERANGYLPWIAAVGLLLGLANFALGVWPSLGQSMVLQLIISGLIGYPLLVVAFTQERFLPEAWAPWKHKAVLVGLFVLIGFIGSEGQLLANYVLFGAEDYTPFSAWRMYVFNGILSIVLGFATEALARPQVQSSLEAPLPATPDTPLSKIPIRSGDGIVLHPLAEVCYFEAYDNYSFLHDVHGKRVLCNYPLSVLEEKLANRFLRIHRKYLVNPEQISRITPHFKGRYEVEFVRGGERIKSSASYGAVMKDLQRL